MTELTFQTARMETGQLIIDIPPDQRGAVMRFLRTKKDKPYDLQIKEHRKKRSLDANAYAWVLIGRIADAMRLPPDEVYRQAIVNIGGNYEIIPVKEEAVASSKRYGSTKELAGRSLIWAHRKSLVTETSEPTTARPLTIPSK